LTLLCRWALSACACGRMRLVASTGVSFLSVQWQPSALRPPPTGSPCNVAATLAAEHILTNVMATRDVAQATAAGLVCTVEYFLFVNEREGNLKRLLGATVDVEVLVTPDALRVCGSSACACPPSC
jgi:hypothetical protein